MRAIGIQPDLIICRTEHEISEEMKDKIALFCNVEAGNVIENRDADTLYEVPLVLEEQGLATKVCKRLGLKCETPNLDEWKRIVEIEKTAEKRVKIALVGKYVELHDAYLSVAEALKHAGIASEAW